MTDTRTGHIYKVVCSKSNDVYVGMTFNALRTRMSQHRSSFQQGKILGIYDSFKKYGWGSLKMMHIASYEVVDRNHLMVYETLWVNKLRAINKNVPFKLLSDIMVNKPKKLARREKDKKDAERAYKSVELNAKKEAEVAPDMTSDEIEELKLLYFKEKSRIDHEYESPDQLPDGSDKLLEMEKHPVILLLLKNRRIMSLHQMIDHDLKLRK